MTFRDRYPSFQNMGALGKTENEVRAHLDSCRRYAEATELDIWIENVTETLEPVMGQMRPACRYRLRWNSFAGWRAYMLMTGCLTGEREPAHPCA